MPDLACAQSSHRAEKWVLCATENITWLRNARGGMCPDVNSVRRHGGAAQPENNPTPHVKRIPRFLHWRRNSRNVKRQEVYMGHPLRPPLIWGADFRPRIAWRFWLRAKRPISSVSVSSSTKTAFRSGRATTCLSSARLLREEVRLATDVPVGFAGGEGKFTAFYTGCLSSSFIAGGRFGGSGGGALDFAETRGEVPPDGKPDGALFPERGRF